ncbi:Uncharacterised protein [Clostridium putrefaciens]|uniref:Uncharacterized protein n=1 Tax=Clostridium putrefaciens TaxID=99675 RepID=A0A381J8J2_9CLOT|nr:hypothetical protein [Clostridium putrefaciens]SUY47531.1 Uncharacterised protein [Clostridium putrefaciens]
MSVLDNMLTKFIKIYNSNKQEELKRLGETKIKLLKKIEIEKEEYNLLQHDEQESLEKFKVLDRSYVELMDILRNKGMLFEISNKGQVLEEWDNLFVDNIKSKYYLKNKYGSIIHELEEEYKEPLKYILDRYSYSLLVIRIDKNKIKVQLRIM